VRADYQRDRAVMKYELALIDLGIADSDRQVLSAHYRAHLDALRVFVAAGAMLGLCVGFLIGRVR
jgi:hypothetical protein